MLVIPKILLLESVRNGKKSFQKGITGGEMYFTIFYNILHVAYTSQ